MYVGFRVSRRNPAETRQLGLGCVALVEQFPHRGGIEVLFWREAPARHFACSFPAGSASPQMELGDPCRTAGVEGAEAVSDGSLYRSMYAPLFVALSRRTRAAASDGPSRSRRFPPPQDAIRPEARRPLFALARVKTFSKLPGLDEQTVGIELVVEPIPHPPRPRWAAAGRRSPEPRCR